MDAATRASRYSAVLVEQLWTMLEEEKTKVGGSCPFDVVVEANDLSFKREAVTKENEELKKRMSGVEEMVANLIVDQQAMAKAFQERGD